MFLVEFDLLVVGGRADRRRVFVALDLFTQVFVLFLEDVEVHFVAVFQQNG